MMKYVLIPVACLLIAITAQAQPKEKAYEQTDILLTAGVSFGYFGFYGNYTSATIPVIIGAEYALLEYVSLGGFAGYQSYSYTGTYRKGKPPYNKVEYSYAYSVISLGLKGSFHVFPYVNYRFRTGIDDSKMDAYLTAYAGASFHTYREKANTGYTDYDRLRPRYIIGPGAGFRYMFTNNFGAFAEVGVGPIGFTTMGVVLKL